MRKSRNSAACSAIIGAKCRPRPFNPVHAHPNLNILFLGVDNGEVFSIPRSRYSILKVPVARPHPLILCRIWDCTVLSYTNRSIWRLPSLPSLPSLCSPAYPHQCYLELLFGFTVAPHWFIGKESVPVADTWCAWNLVDRSSDRWGKERVRIVSKLLPTLTACTADNPDLAP